MSWQFQYKEFVWLFVAIAVLALLFLSLLRWKRNTLKKIGDEKLVKLLINNFSSNRFIVKFILLVAAFALGIVAVMNPRKPGDADNISRKVLI